MNKIELKRFAIKELNTKKVQNIKKQLCNQFIDNKQKRDCMKSFTPFLISNAHFRGQKIRKNAKSIVGISPTIVLLFLLLVLFSKK